MSCHFWSRKISTPSARNAFTMAGPSRVKSWLPTLKRLRCGLRRRTNASASSARSTSRARISLSVMVLRVLLEKVKQFAPAKINLYLHILGRRADGFHELETLMAPISLGDTLDIDLIAGGIEFTCSDPALADAKDNLATKAARLFLEEFKLTTGIRIHLEKAVPVGAGLGGGSSDAAAVLLALRELTKTKCDDAKLAELAARLGSDI